MSKFQGDIIVDHMQPSLPAYRALGALPKGQDNCCFVFEQIFVGTYHGIKAVWVQGHHDLVKGVAKSDFLVQGGCLVLDEETSVVYRKMFTKTSEHWPIDELVLKMCAGAVAVRVEK